LFLRSLSLLGFKTFARPTEIRFEGGVTAIVGPNGSGKTNIVDAVKWVLGSGQARDLRGRKMEEVIYVGGERRSRAASPRSRLYSTTPRAGCQSTITRSRSSGELSATARVITS
jgi:chromosome segregation ATPase